jgi:hypothetical protein
MIWDRKRGASAQLSEMQIDRIRVKLLPCRSVLLCLSDDVRPRNLPEHVLISHGKFERGHDNVEMTGLDEIVAQVATTLLVAIIPDSPVSVSIASRTQKHTAHSTTRHEGVSERLSVENSR